MAVERLVSDFRASVDPGNGPHLLVLVSAPARSNCKYRSRMGGGIWARNLVLMTAVAGGLHLYLYTIGKQGDRLRFDSRPLKTTGRTFTFGGQVRDNMFWTLASGVTIWTAYEVLIFWAMANDYAPVLTWEANPAWFVALFLLIPAWESFYFYWIHRMLHVPALYRRFHALHHRNTNVGPWSGLSMHPVEHLIYLGSVLIHFVVAAHPVHVLYHLQYFCLSAATTHSGFEGLEVGGRKQLGLGTFHHQLHHRYFECNYGSLSIPWDKLFGTFHDGTQDLTRRSGRTERRWPGALLRNEPVARRPYSAAVAAAAAAGPPLRSMPR